MPESKVKETRTSLKRRPPGPKGLPFIGMIREYASDQLGFLTNAAKTYGDVFVIPMMGEDIYVFVHPDAMEEILVKNHTKFHKNRGMKHLSVGVGQGLLISEDQVWKQSRKLVAPSFKRKQIATYADTMVRHALHHSKKLQHVAMHDITQVMNHLALDVVAETMFGASIGEHGELISEAVDHMMDWFVQRMRSWRRILPPNFPTLRRRRAQRKIQEVDEVLFRIIEERRRSTEERNDLLHLLLHATDEDGNTLSDQQLRDEAFTIFVAGHETTALSLSYAVWLLAMNPERQRRMCAEVDQVLQGRPATADDLKDLSYTNAVIHEAMRLYPPAWAIGREALEDIDILGTFVPKGAQIFLPPWVVHRDERWYDSPQEFHPERWIEKPASERHRFAWMPFGGGARICVGNHFAMMEANLLLATLFQHVQFAPIDQAPLELSPAVTLRPAYGIPLHIRPRNLA